MEFGIFLQGHTPDHRVAENPNYESYVLLREIEVAVAADKAGFKYCWMSEHHFLEEYSHTSASGSLLAFIAAKTEQMHVATGIRNLHPTVNHPIRVAEEAATMDIITGGRFELGTGRGAGQHEVHGFDIDSADETEPMWREAITELPKMWRETEYSHEDGVHFRVPGKRNVLPKPLGPSHPPLWVAAGSPDTFVKAGEMGLGVIGFSIGSIDSIAKKVAAYKDGISRAEPVGDWINDNIMTTTTAIVMEDGQKAREAATKAGLSLLHAGVYRYHSTMPRPDYVPTWPERLPEPDLDTIEFMIEGGFMFCGDPDEVTQQMKRAEATGVDQVSISLAIDMPQEVALETVRLMGEHVIPVFDTDPEHRTTKQRREQNT